MTPRMLTINVTADDIARGDIDSVTACPIGLAFQRAVGHADVSVDRINIIDKRTGERAVWSRGAKSGNILVGTPPEAAEFQTAILQGRKVRPFSFTVKMELP